MRAADEPAAFRRPLVRVLIVLLITVLLATMMGPVLLAAAGAFLVVDSAAERADAAVVLTTGVEYPPRLLEAARLYRAGRVRQIAINGNRKSDVIRDLEQKGLRPCCPWYETSLRILEMSGVPRDRVMVIDAPQAYDTVSEAAIVGKELNRRGIERIIVTTSKYHSRRACFIWNRMHGDQFGVQCTGAVADPFDAGAWWHDGRQVRWVLSEYGAWMYFWWKVFRTGTQGPAESGNPDTGRGGAE